MEKDIGKNKVAWFCGKLAWLSVPGLLLAIAALWIVDSKTVYESQPLLMAFNFVFSTLASILVVILLGRSFFSRGSPGMLLLSCGVLLWGSAGTVAPMLLPHGANVVISVHNILVWLAALCNAAGVVLLLKPGRDIRRTGWVLTVAYTAVTAAVWLIAMLVLEGRLPVFFVQGQGGTLLREFVLGSSVLMFAGTSVLLWAAHRRTPTPFVRWYGLALLLVATGLFGIMIETVHGSILGWVARAAQFLGGACLLVAAIVSLRGPGEKEILPESGKQFWQKDEFLASFRQQTLLGWLLRYGFAIVAVAAGMGLRLALTARIGPGLPTYITFYPAVMVAALLCGFGPGFVATASTILFVAYWILPPEGLAVSLLVERLGMVLFTCMGLFMSAVAELYRRNRDKAAAYDREHALIETNREKEFLANILENAEQPFAVGFPDGSLGRMNRAFEELTGYTAAEFRAIDWSTTLTPPEWREPERQKLEELHRTGHPVRYEKEYIRKDGSRVPIELLVHLVRDEHDKLDYYYSFLTDITERKRAEEESQQLHRSVEQEKERLKSLVQSITDEIWFADTAGKFTLVNPSGSQAFALGSVGTVDVRKLAASLKVLRPDGSPRPVEEAPPLRALRGEIVKNEEEMLRTPATGELRWRQVSASPVSDAAGNIVGSVSVVRDITERKRDIAILQQSEERLRLAQESAHVGIWDWEVTTGKLEFTPELHKLYGLPPGTIKTYQDWRERVHSDDIGKIEARRDEAIAKHESFDLEFRGRQSSGEYRWISTKGGALYDEAGKVTRVFGVNIDITERKQAEEALQQHIKEIEVLNDALTEFNRASVGRELLMVELKKEVNDLCARAGQPTPYDLDFESEKV